MDSTRQIIRSILSESPHYLDIGHEKENSDAWALRRDSDDLVIASEIDMHINDLHYVNHDRVADSRGRIDHQKKAISILPVSKDEERSRYAAKLLHMKYPDYTLYLFRDGKAKLITPALNESEEPTPEAIQAYLDEISAGCHQDEYFPGPEQLPDDGGDALICTNSATLIAKKFGGKVVGYRQEDNPSALVGADEGGHDFTIVGPYIVDWWWEAVYGVPDTKVVLDTRDPAEQEAIRKLYGDPTTWEQVWP